MLIKIKSLVELIATYKFKNTVELQFIKKIKCKFLFVSIKILKPIHFNDDYDCLIHQCICIEYWQLTKTKL